jgi:hypothetical protein
MELKVSRQRAAGGAAIPGLRERAAAHGHRSPARRARDDLRREADDVAATTSVPLLPGAGGLIGKIAQVARRRIADRPLPNRRAGIPGRHGLSDREGPAVRRRRRVRAQGE